MVVHINISLEKLPTFMLEFDIIEKSNVAYSLIFDLIRIILNAGIDHSGRAFSSVNYTCVYY